GRSTISFAGTRLSEHPIHRYSGACCSAKRVKKSLSETRIRSDHLRFCSSKADRSDMAIALTSIRKSAILAPAVSMLSAMVRPFGHGLTPIVTYTSPDGQQARRTRIVRMEGLRCAAAQCADRALVLGDHLRAEQQHQGRDFQAEQYDDGGREGSVD